jgi:hypothetical protein
MKSSSISRVPANKSQGLVILAQSGKRDRSHTLEHQLALPTSGDAKTMKTKTWTVIANTGKQADLESGLEKKTVQKPTYISPRDFTHWLAAKSRIDDASLQSLFKR